MTRATRRRDSRNEWKVLARETRGSMRHVAGRSARTLRGSVFPWPFVAFACHDRPTASLRRSGLARDSRAKLKNNIRVTPRARVTQLTLLCNRSAYGLPMRSYETEDFFILGNLSLSLSRQRIQLERNNAKINMILFKKLFSNDHANCCYFARWLMSPARESV